MNLRHLAYRLNRMFDMLDEVYRINYGGCCYAAYCIASLLKKSNIDYQLVIVEDDEDKFENVYDISELEESHSHYGILIDNQYEVNISHEDVENAMLVEDNPDPSDIQTHYEQSYWNDDYDTSKNEFIRRIITTFYNDFVNDN